MDSHGWGFRETESFQRSAPAVARLGVHVMWVDLLELPFENDLFLEIKVENQSKRAGPIVNPQSRSAFVFADPSVTEYQTRMERHVGV